MEGVCGEREEEIGIGEKQEEKKREKKRKRKERRKEMRKGTGTNVAPRAESDGKGPGNVLREVGFLLLRLFYA